MDDKYKKIYTEYTNKGFCILKNVIDPAILEAAYQEIISSDKTSVFKDQSGQLRRIESIYDKGPNLININNTFLGFLNVFF